MSKVIVGLSTSVDGIASGTTESRLWAEQYERVGAQVVGRRLFDYSDPYWGENPPFHAPVFVITHRPAERIEKQGGTSYTFVANGLAGAIDQARAAAGDKDVLIAGGLSIAQQAIAAGLVDEISMHIAPVLLGKGARLFDDIGDAPVRLIPLHSHQGDGATHVSYRVERS
jgi:dihydrofolate reductase